MDFSYVVADAETNGIRPSRIFMVGVMDLMTGEYRSYVGPEQVAEAYYYMSTVSKVVVGHNFEGYDAKVGRDLVGVSIPNEVIVDTLHMSRALCPTLMNHKLETWGGIIRQPKKASPLFEEYSLEMDVYCEQDVRSNAAMFGFLYRLFLFSNFTNLKFNHRVLTQNIEALQKSIVA